MSYSYYWEITLDRIADPTAPAGTNANAKGRHSGDPHVKTRAGIIRSSFEMLDDDGESYYKGFIYHRNGEEQFTPLHEFGAPNAGATTIKIDGEVL